MMLGFLNASTFTGSLDAEVPSSPDKRWVKLGWENVFDRLCFLEAVLLKRETLGINVMPTRASSKSPELF